ncbi:toxin-activating lysine-acyltransferase [Trinickia sp. EG282A]|uniref:toxin-activating lysine-acyltransferase n=1 Tax=Trinickia sp. EG282A TaxID=3237013 RepID=UPI0034D2E4FC
MRNESLEIIAPGLLNTPCNEAEALGSAVWLWMHSAAHRDAPLHVLASALLPAIKHKQFVLAAEAGKPVFYLAWASFCEAAEARYLSHPPELMLEADWASGDRIWILDWVAPFGHTRILRRLVARLFADRCLRSLYHRGDERGLRVMEFNGIAVTKEEARTWFFDHPIACPLPHSKDRSK